MTAHPEPSGGGRPRAEFVSEPLTPVAGTFATAAMASGEPGLPARFRWRGVEHEVAAVLETRRGTGPCRHGGGERYVRRHEYRIRTAGGLEMLVYCDRQPRRGARPRARWWVATVERDAVAPPA